MQITPIVAIVILNYNGKHHLEKFLPSVIASSYTNKKIIVADNCSNDDSLSWLRDTYPAIEVIKNKENFGFAKGYNEALKMVDADYYVLLNSDVEVTEGWMEPIISLMESDVTIAACQPKLLAYNNKHLFEYAGASGGWIDMFGYPFSRGRVFDFLEVDEGQYNSVEKIFWASGAAMFVRSSIFREMKGLDEYFFAHQEEIDLCWRMQLAGYTIMACPQSVVYHVGAGTLPRGGKKVFLNFRNNLIMLAKNYSQANAVWKIPIRLILDWVAIFKALLLGDFFFAKAVIKAHGSFMAWLLSSKKNNNFAAVKSGSLDGYYKGSVIWDHFIKNKKTFKEIIN